MLEVRPIGIDIIENVPINDVTNEVDILENVHLVFYILVVVFWAPIDDVPEKMSAASCSEVRLIGIDVNEIAPMNEVTVEVDIIETSVPSAVFSSSFSGSLIESGFGSSSSSRCYPRKFLIVDLRADCVD